MTSRVSPAQQVLTFVWPTWHVRGGLCALLIGNGLIRLIDGRLFNLSPLAYGRDAAYGALLLSVGLFLLVTLRQRRRRSGQLAAVLAAALWAWLAFVAAETSAISAFNAGVFAVAAFIEARAWVLGGYQ